MGPTGKTKKDSPERLRFLLTEHTFLMAVPAGFALAVMTLWYFVAWKGGVHLPGEDSEIVGLVPYVLVVLIYVFKATVIFTDVWQKYRAYRTLAKQDKLKSCRHEFLLIRDERTPEHALRTVLFMSTLVVSMISLLHWHSVFGGLLAVGSSAFTVAEVWMLITRLDNPRNDLWLFERVPAEWWTADIDAEFSLDGVSDHPVQPVELRPVDKAS